MIGPRILGLCSESPIRCWNSKHRCFFSRREQILTTAKRVFGDRKIAEIWLSKPAFGLGRFAPCSLLAKHQGYVRVRDFLVRIEYGVYQ